MEGRDGREGGSTGWWMLPWQDMGHVFLAAMSTLECEYSALRTPLLHPDHQQTSGAFTVSRQRSGGGVDASALFMQG